MYLSLTAILSDFAIICYFSCASLKYVCKQHIEIGFHDNARLLWHANLLYYHNVWLIKDVIHSLLIRIIMWTFTVAYDRPKSGDDLLCWGGQTTLDPESFYGSQVSFWHDCRYCIMLNWESNVHFLIHVWHLPVHVGCMCTCIKITRICWGCVCVCAYTCSCIRFTCIGSPQSQGFTWEGGGVLSITTSISIARIAIDSREHRNIQENQATWSTRIASDTRICVHVHV